MNNLKVQVDTTVIPAFQKSQLRKTVQGLLAKVVGLQEGPGG